MSRRRVTRARDGVALIVVLWAVVLLTGVTALASANARASADVAGARRAASIAHAMATSGVVAGSDAIDESLHRFALDSLARDRFLDDLELQSSSPRGGALSGDTLQDGVFDVTVLDVSARLDVNSAGADGWFAFLRFFTNDMDARAIADRVDARVRGDANADSDGAMRAPAESLAARDALVAKLLGRNDAPRRRQAFESVEELLAIEGVTPALLARMAPQLTVDGNGTVNRVAASRAVIAAAAGSLVDHPVRLLISSRGWELGSLLTREIEAVYDVAPDGLHLVRWRERER